MKKIIYTMALLPLICNADVDYKQLQNQGASINDTVLINGAMSEIKKELSPSIYPRVNYDQSKIDALKGNWIVSYNMGRKPYTDRLAITDNYTNTDGELMASGLLYANNTGSGSYMLCEYRPETFNVINADYLCLQITNYGGLSITSTYAMRINGNTITGYFGIGSVDAAVSAMLNRRYPIIGSKQIMTTVTPPAPAINLGGEYNSATQELILPDVKVGNDRYNAVLIYQGNDTFKIQSTVKK